VAIEAGKAAAGCGVVGDVATGAAPL